MSIISTSLTVPGQPSPRFHVEAWLPFSNCEMDYWSIVDIFDFRTQSKFSLLLAAKKQHFSTITLHNRQTTPTCLKTFKMFLSCDVDRFQTLSFHLMLIRECGQVYNTIVPALSFFIVSRNTTGALNMRYVSYSGVWTKAARWACLSPEQIAHSVKVVRWRGHLV